MPLSLIIKCLLVSPNPDVIIVQRMLSCSVFPSPFPKVLGLFETHPGLAEQHSPGLEGQHSPGLAKISTFCPLASQLVQGWVCDCISVSE